MTRQVNDDIYAKVFVSNSLEIETFTELLCRFSETAVRGTFFEIHTDEISVDVRNNDDYDPQKTEFINFRYYLDINSLIGIDEGRFLNALAKLVAFIKKQGFPVVTACVDEDQLARLVKKELTV